jgi:hypothetical protein
VNRSISALFVLVLLVILAHRSPAPISDESPTPAPEQSKQRTASPPKTQAASQPKFDGTWRTTSMLKDQNGNVISDVRSLTIRNGTTATWVDEQTSTLTSGKSWPRFPSPYDSIPTIWARWTNESTKLRMEGPNLKIEWPEEKFVEWSPKNIPSNLFRSVLGLHAVIYRIEDDHLISTGTTTRTWTRIK